MPSDVIVQPRFCAIVRVEAPLMVLEVGVIVTVPAPSACESNENPVVNPVVPAWGRVTAIEAALLKVTSFPASPDDTV